MNSKPNFEAMLDNFVHEPINDFSNSRFTELVCWQKCRELRIQLTELTKSFPKEEKNRLSDQIIRAARSTTNNIAEGFGRYHYKDSIKFYYISRGSLYELIDHLLIAQECDFLTSEENQKYESMITEATKVLNGYIQYVLSKIK